MVGGGGIRNTDLGPVPIVLAHQRYRVVQDRHEVAVRNAPVAIHVVQQKRYWKHTTNTHCASKHNMKHGDTGELVVPLQRFPLRTEPDTHAHFSFFSLVAVTLNCDITIANCLKSTPFM